MRLGGAVMKEYGSPVEWLKHVKELGYSCVVFPVDSRAPKSVIRDYAACAKDNDLIIGEVGIWKNLFHADDRERQFAYDWSVRQLELAEEVGANCCVNISGSLGSKWDGYHKDNLTKKTYDRIVEISQRLIDEVNPKHTHYSLEPMPWMYPDSPESYLQLIKDIDRAAFAVHLDYANMINGIERYQKSDQFINHSFDLLGKYITSIHAKDLLADEVHLPVMISEILPGNGGLNLGLVLKRAEALSEDMTVFVEHLNTHEDYVKAISHMRKTAEQVCVHIK